MQASTSAASLAGIDTIDDAIADGRGHVVLIERRRTRLVVTDMQLRPLTVVPFRLDGKTHLWWPGGLARLDAGEIAVLDRQTHNIVRLTVAPNGEAITWGSSVHLPLRSVSGFCALTGGDFLVYGLNRGTRLHVIDGRTGAITRSFAPADSTLHTKAQDLTTQGPLGCDNATDEALVASSFRPTMEAYRISTGQPVWTDRLSPYRAPVFHDGDSTVTLGSGMGGYTQPTTLAYVGDYRLIQAPLISKSGEHAQDADTAVTYTYSRTTNLWLAPSLSLPQFFLLDANHVLTVTRNPTEVVSIDKLEIGGRSTNPSSR